MSSTTKRRKRAGKSTTKGNTPRPKSGRELVREAFLDARAAYVAPSDRGSGGNT